MSFSSTAVTLILVMDPLGNIPLFLSILKRFDPKTQAWIILRECAIAFAVLLLFLFFGQHILTSLNITMPALSIGGGIILFLIAIRMIFPSGESEAKSAEQQVKPYVVPLAIPLTAGPSALATVLLFASRNPVAIWQQFWAIVVACLVFVAIMLPARYLMKVLGDRGLIAIERLMGMILTIVSVQMFLSGLKDYWALPL